MKRKTNISVQDNLGTRVSSNMIVGDKYNGYTSGDILDANATVDAIKKTISFSPDLGDGSKFLADNGTWSDPNVKGLVSTIHIDESNADGSHKVLITGDIATQWEDGNIVRYEDGRPVVKNPETNVISWIRLNSRLVYAQYDTDLNVMKIADRDYIGHYEDGTLKSDGRGTVNVFMKLPRFWYKCINTRTGCDIFFTKDCPNDNSWIEWDGNTFIGCYKRNDPSDLSFHNMSNTGVSSMAGVNVSHNAIRNITKWFKQQGAGISTIKYDTHKIMEILQYAFYGTVDIKSVCGIGEDLRTGDSKKDYDWPMSDVPVDINADSTPQSVRESGSTFFWGLCDWYGNINEWVDDIKILGYKTIQNEEGNDVNVYTLGIIDENDNVIRTIDNVPYNDDLTLKKVWGQYADVIPTLSTGDYESELDGGYTVSGYVNGDPGSVAYRGGDGSCVYAGAGYLDVNYDPDYSYANLGARLQYHGPWVEVNNEDLNIDF